MDPPPGASISLTTTPDAGRRIHEEMYTPER